MNALLEKRKSVAVARPQIRKNVREELPNNGNPVYLYRTLFNEMSLMGSDLMVEPHDEDDL